MSRRVASGVATRRSEVRPWAAAVAALGCAALAAALYTVASPPHDLAWLAWAAPGLLLAPLAGAPLRRAAAAGFVFGLGIAVGITSWAAHASLRYFDLDPVAATLFAVLVWVLASALPYALLATAFAWLARRVPVVVQPVAAAWLWVLVEMLRSVRPFGLPWGLLSHTQWRESALIQIADLGGAYAVTFVLVLVSTAVAQLARDAAAGTTPLRPAARLLPAALAVAAAVLYGAHARSARAAAPHADWRSVAVVQSDRASGFHWNRLDAEREMLAYARLTDGIAAEPDDLDLIVWPENAVDLYLDREPFVLGRLGATAAKKGAELVLGAPRLADATNARNAAYLIDAGGRVRGAYDKRLLVPVAELPLFAPDAAAAEEPRWVGGAASAPLAGTSARLGTTICYEVLFPQLVRDNVRDGADLLVNVSNDSWLDAGDGAAPRQHFAMAVLRAVEMRRALVRASAGGRSGLVSPLGEVIATVDWGASGSAVGRVPLSSEITPYARWGEAWVAAVGVVVAAAWLAGSPRGRPC